MPRKTTYKDAGVDTEAGSRLVELIKPLAASTHTKGVVGGVGGFSALFAPDLSGMEAPLLVTSTDGVGTKLKIAFDTGVLDTVGIDLVAMCVNDILTCGATPLFFLDYLATSRLEPERAAMVIEGIARGCREAGCALLGGETAEMPGFYAPEEFDVAGFVVGVVDTKDLVDGSGATPGSSVIALPSSGLHSNGYSLVRKVLIEDASLALDSIPEGLGRTLAEELLEPTRIYATQLAGLARKVRPLAIAHITGGGLVDNVPRVLPPGAGVELRPGTWDIQPVFTLIEGLGAIGWDEMYGTFNCGVGMVVVVSAEDEPAALAALREMGEDARVIGEVVAVGGGEERVRLL